MFQQLGYSSEHPLLLLRQKTIGEPIFLLQFLDYGAASHEGITPDGRCSEDRGFHGHGLAVGDEHGGESQGVMDKMRRDRDLVGCEFRRRISLNRQENPTEP